MESKSWADGILLMTFISREAINVYASVAKFVGMIYLP
jgi:hypothetical protein